MSAASYDVDIENARKQLDEARNRAEALFPQYATVLAEFVSGWANYLVERAVTEKPDVTKRLGKERIAEMKKRFHEIEQSIPSITQRWLTSADAWPHRTDFSQAVLASNLYSLSDELTRKRNNVLDDGIRNLIQPVGALLIEYGFATTEKESEWEATTGGSPRYRLGIPPYGFSQTAEPGKLHAQYGEALKGYVFATKKLNDALRAKESGEAKDLWDQA